MTFDSSLFPEPTFLTSKGISTPDEQINTDLISDSVSARHPLALNSLDLESAIFESGLGSKAYAFEAETVYIADANTDAVTGLAYADAAVSIQQRSDGSRASAHNMGALRGSRTIRDSVDGRDRSDYYKFTLERRREFTLTLTNLDGNANVQLLNSNGDVIKASQNTGAKSERIKRTLGAGDYFVQVFSDNKNVNTDYRLTLSEAAVGSSKPDKAGNSRDMARDFGVLNQSRRIKDFVGRNDRNDVYRFSLSRESEFSLLLNGLTENADVRLLDSRGRAIETSTTKKEDAERIERTLAAGDYFIEVLSYKQSDTAYKLQLSATEAQSDLDGSLSTANDIGTLGRNNRLNLIRSGDIGSANSDDYYRFDVNGSLDLEIRLMLLETNANIQLLNSRGQLIQASANGGNASETISKRLETGQYYLRVYSDSPESTYYFLSLAATVIPTDGAGNTLGNALNIGDLNGDRTFQDFIGTEDTNDYYRFNLQNNSNFTLSLSDLSSDAEVQLLDNTGQVIESSTGAGSSTETITRSLTAGRYYVRVYPYSGSTDYTLNLSATEIDVDLAGNTFGRARDIGNLSGSRSFQDVVGTTDTDDYYRFTLDRSSSFSLTMNGLSTDADVELLRSDGSVLSSSLNSNSSDELITQTLDAGTYYVRIYPFSGTTDYNLTLSATAIRSNDGTGNTVGTAKNIGLLDSTRTFQESIGGTADPNDYYRFRIERESGFDLSLTGLSTDVDVEVLDSNGQSLANSTGPYTSDEAIDGTLSPGTYYVRVYPDDINQRSNYQLTLSATELAAGFDTTYGYGLVDASASVAAAIGRSNPLPEADELTGINWGLDLVNAQDAWDQGYSGEGVVIAVIDTGVDYLHDDIFDNLWTNTDEIADNGIDDDGNGYVDDIAGWDFSGRDNDPYDEQGHGTHVAGIAAGVGFNYGVTGVAYESEIMAVRVLGADGSGSNEDIANGIRYAADNGADVINLSLGGDTSSSVLRSAIQYATSQGSFVVAASGNESASRPAFPGRYATDYGVVVGAVDRYKTAAYFSNDAGNDSNMHYVVAPGYSIYSAVPGNSYEYKNGTSMAAPYVAGIVALMLDANPNLTHAQIRQILTDSASRLS